MYAQTIQNYGFLVLFIASVTVLGAILLAYGIGYRRGLKKGRASMVLDVARTWSKHGGGKI